jgi:ketosteroid isomerase-like protein
MSTATEAVKDQTPTLSKDQAEIRALIDGIHRAHHDKNVHAIAGPYSDQAAIFNLAPPLIHRGVNIQEKQAWLDSWDGPIELESRDWKISVSGDQAYCHFYIHMSGTPKMAGRQISFWMRETLCLQRESGSWKIVHEHTSVPFYMDGTQRPAFDLQP